MENINRDDNIFRQLPRLVRQTAIPRMVDDLDDIFMNDFENIDPATIAPKSKKSKEKQAQKGAGLVNSDNSHNPALLSSNQGAVVGYIGSSNKVDAAMGKGVHYKTLKGGKRKPKKKSGKKKYGKKHGKTAKKMHGKKKHGKKKRKTIKRKYKK